MELQNATLTQEDYRNYFEKAVSYDTYLDNFQREIGMGESIPFAEYLPQNWQRQSRLDRKLKITPELHEAIDQLEKPVKWLIITEHWCGDASQINPVIAKAAAASNGKIDLRLIYRDQEEELIDAHLTNGKSRSIPLLLQFDENFQFTGKFGPRPSGAQQHFEEVRAKGEDYKLALHTWYARDKQKEIQAGLAALLTKY